MQHPQAYQLLRVLRGQVGRFRLRRIRGPEQGEVVGVTMGGAEGEVGTMVDVEALAEEDISGRLVCVPCNQ